MDKISVPTTITRRVDFDTETGKHNVIIDTGNMMLVEKEPSGILISYLGIVAPLSIHFSNLDCPFQEGDEVIITIEKVQK